jgi:hypothetical protein
LDGTGTIADVMGLTGTDSAVSVTFVLIRVTFTLVFSEKE